MVSRQSISHRLLCVSFFILTLQGLGRGVRWIKLIFDLKLLFCLGGNFTTFLKHIEKYFDRKVFLSYDPRVTSSSWLNGWNFIFQKCDVNKIISFRVYKLSIFEIYNEIPSSANRFESTRGLKSMGINFFTKCIKIMTWFHKKCWHHYKNDHSGQILVWYCVLRVTYTNLSIFNQLC